MKKIFTYILILFFLCCNFAFSSEATERLLGGIVIENVKKSSHELLYYIVHKETQNVKNLLDKGENPNSSFMGVSAQFFAIYCDCPDILNLLLEYGADVNSVCYGETILSFAIYRNNIDCVRVLINSGSDLNLKSNGILPLNLALSKKNYEIAGILYKNGAQPDKKSLKIMKKQNISLE